MARTPARRDGSSTPSITSVGRSHQQDINSRMARYALAMAIRTACFILIFVLPSPWRWVAGGGALLLPYVAVLIANAGRERLPVAWGTGRTRRPVESPVDDAEAPPAVPQAVMPVQVVRGETVEHGGGGAERADSADRADRVDRADASGAGSGDGTPRRGHAA